MNEQPASVQVPPPGETVAWALREPETKSQRAAVEVYLSGETAPQVARFAPYHDDRLNAQVLDGRFNRVIFADLDALLTGVWKGYLHLDEWLKAGVQLEILDSPVPPDQLRKVLAGTYQSYVRYQQMHRRRRTFAAIVLGLLTLAAMASMIWLIPPMR